mgnify:CR=1 FL=1
MKRRRSVQRDRIYQLISTGNVHPTAQWILTRMKEEFPAVNESNLYRNIRILIEEGRIVVRDTGDGVEHYDANTSSHYHFICEQCGKISDIDMAVDRHVEQEMQKHIPHSIASHTINFYGICEDCQRTIEEDE